MGGAMEAKLWRWAESMECGPFCDWLWWGCCRGRGRRPQQVSWNQRGVEFERHDKRFVWRKLHTLGDLKGLWVWIDYSIKTPVKKLLQLCSRVGIKLSGARMSAIMGNRGQLCDITEETFISWFLYKDFYYEMTTCVPHKWKFITKNSWK